MSRGVRSHEACVSLSGWLWHLYQKMSCCPGLKRLRWMSSGSELSHESSWIPRPLKTFINVHNLESPCISSAQTLRYLPDCNVASVIGEFPYLSLIIISLDLFLFLIYHSLSTLVSSAVHPGCRAYARLRCGLLHLHPPSPLPWLQWLWTRSYGSSPPMVRKGFLCTENLARISWLTHVPKNPTNLKARPDFSLTNTLSAKYSSLLLRSLCVAKGPAINFSWRMFSSICYTGATQRTCTLSEWTKLLQPSFPHYKMELRWWLLVVRLTLLWMPMWSLSLTLVQQSNAGLPCAYERDGFPMDKGKLKYTTFLLINPYNIHASTT